MATANKEVIDSDAASAPVVQSQFHSHAKRPAARRHNTTDSQASDQTSNSSSHYHHHTSAHHNHHHHRTKHTKHVVGGGTSARIPMHARVPSSKGLHKHTSSSTKLTSKRHQSPSPDRSAAAAAGATTTSTSHRRSTSDIKLPSRDSSSSNLRKNVSHSSLVGKRNRSHAEIGKKSKSAASIKRSSSHKDVHKLKGSKSSVHFALGDNDGDDQEDEWVDASGSASPYLSRRGSVASGAPSPGKSREEPRSCSPKSRPRTKVYEKEQEEQKDEEIDDEEEEVEVEEEAEGTRHPKISTQPESTSDSASDRGTTQHKEYLTSRLLQRTPSYSAPLMTKETASVQPRSGSPESVRASLYGTPKHSTVVVGSDQTVDVTSRFVNGAGAEPGSFYTPTTRSPARRLEDVRRPQSFSNLEDKRRDSIVDADPEDEDDSALAPRTTRPARGAMPAEKSRTQQKLNLQRASSSMEPTQPGVGTGVAGSSPLVGISTHDGRDPRIGRQLERTGMEYLVVRRYQNPIARSITRLSHLPGASKTQQIRHPKSNGVNGSSSHAKKPSTSYGLSQSLAESQKSRPTTPGAAAAMSAAIGAGETTSNSTTSQRRRPTSIRTNGANSSYDGDEDHHHHRHRISGASLYGNDAATDNGVDNDDGGLAAILRNLWDKNMDLSASQE